MGYKIKGALKKGKPIFIVVIILWVLLSIVFVAPVAISIVESTNSNDFFDRMFENFSSVGTNLTKIFQPEYIKTFGKGELYLTAVLLLFACVGLVKSMPKNQYTDIEHGSSDWAEHGEQYTVLSSNKGILLAEKNYLPVDKRGNVNVMVVGRFWFW